jgi:zinc protease
MITQQRHSGESRNPWSKRDPGLWIPAFAGMTVLFLMLIFTTPAHAITVESVKSAGGIEAWLVTDHSLPIIAIQFEFRGGGRLDPVGKEGLSDFTISMLTEGTQELNQRQFQQALVDNAISIGFDADKDGVTGSLRTLSENKETAFDLLRQSLMEPRFDAADIERIRSQFISALKAEDDEPSSIASKAWWKAAFPNHPYGRHPTEATVKAITADDLKNYMHHFQRGNLIIGVAGDIDKEELAKILDQIFGGLPQESNASIKPAAQSIPLHSQKDPIFIARDLPQTVAVFGQSGLRRSDPDFYPFYILNHILGGGSFSSYLMKEVREKRGLAYSISTGLDTYEDTGILAGSVATKKESFNETLAQTRQVWQELPDKINDRDVVDAKKFLIGSFPLRFRSTPQIAGILMAMQRDHLPIDFLDKRNDIIESVTTEQVIAVAKKYLKADQLLFTIVGTPEPKKE